MSYFHSLPYPFARTRIHVSVINRLHCRVVGHRDILIPFNFIMRKLESEIRVRERLPPKQWPAGSLIIFGIALPPPPIATPGTLPGELSTRENCHYRLDALTFKGFRPSVLAAQTPVRKRTVFIRLTELDVSPCGTF